MVAPRIDGARERLARVDVGPHRVGDPEDDRREDERDDGCREHADARLVLRVGVVDGDVDDEQRDREADAAQRGAAGEAVEGQSGAELAEFQQLHERRRSEDAEELADDESDDDAPGEGGGQRAWPRISGLSTTPALARANSGRITYATYGA